MVELWINGDETSVNAQTMTAILAELNLDDAVVATALNGEFIPIAARAGTKVANGDKIEILAPMQGG
jgi:sulfur carrier protein